MKKGIYLKLITVLFVISVCKMSSVFAVEQNVQNTDEEVVVNQTEQENEENIRLQKEELNSIIKELVNTLKSGINNINEKIENIRNTEEYTNYPAIRLNIDTPIFGLESIVNNKLKIRQDVSASDVATGYSIRYIIKNNAIKLPDVLVAGIVVSTRDVKFDENIEIADANTAIAKLMQYEKTIDNVSEFVDNQINKIFKGYIPKDKYENIENVRSRLSKVEETLLSQDDDVLRLYILSVNDEVKNEYNETLNEYLNLSKIIKECNKKVENVLISQEEFTSVQKDLLDVETNIITFAKDLDTALDNLKDYNVEEVLNHLKSEITERKNKVEQYIDNSVILKEIPNENENVTENTESTENVQSDTSQVVNETKTNTNTDTNTNTNTNNTSDTTTVEEIKKYDVVSTEYVDNMQSDIDKLNEKIKNYIKEDKTDNNENTDTDTEKEDNNTEITNEISLEEKETLLNELLNMTKDYITNENKFYLDNINTTLNNTTSVISDLARYTKTNVIEEMRYIYLELPDTLEGYLDSNNTNSYIETRNLSDSLYTQINKLSDVYVKMSNIYDELNVDEIKSKD